MKASLPWRGLALSSNLNVADEPRPYRLLDAHPGIFDALEYSAPLDVAQARREASLFAEMDRRRSEVPVLFHPVHLNLWGPELESPEVLRQLDAHARAVGSPWVGNDVAWWHASGQAFPGYLYVTPPFDRASLDACTQHALHVQSQLSLPLVLENPAVLTKRGELHVLDFMAELHRRTGAPLLLDLGHLWSYQLAAGLPMEAALDGFPLEQVVEIHIAGGVVTRNGAHSLYVDDHTQPIREELFELLERVMPRCSRLRCLTYEGDGHPDEIAVRNLQRLRKWIPREQRPELEVEFNASETSAPVESRGAWELFAKVHSEEGPERDFRLAVIAEQVDRAFPLTRLLLAGTPERLRAFASSDEYRSGFEGMGKTVESTFGSWARRLSREENDEAIQAVVAFELSAGHRVSHADGKPGRGSLSLPPGVVVAGFPLDLSETIFAARALKRHLAGRAWASGSLETSGLEALLQTVRRARPGMWQHALRRRAGGWEALELNPLRSELFRLTTEPATKELSPELKQELRTLLADGWVRLAEG